MSTLQASRPRFFRPLLTAIALAAALMAAVPAKAEIIRKDDMLRGITIAQSQCTAMPQAVWIHVEGRDFCVRYYISTAGGEGKRPVVFLQGDKLGPLELKTLRWTDHSKTTDVDTADLVRFADTFSKMTKTTAIYLARIGVDGTSGDHRSRKTVLELQLMNAALDAIKKRHGFEGFHIAGQSGGSQLLGGLIGLRQDIGCAVAGSGQFIENNMHGDPARTYFDAAKYIPVALERESLRLMVVTDLSDRQVPAKMQTVYVQKLRRAGVSVPHFMVEATDDRRHGVVEYARLAMAGCILGRSDAEIDRAIHTLVKRNAAFNAQKQREAQAKSRIREAAQATASANPGYAY
jgi:hypothetical protein